MYAQCGIWQTDKVHAVDSQNLGAIVRALCGGRHAGRRP